MFLINGESSCVILIGHESGRRKYIEVRKDRKSKEICLAHLTCPWKQEKIPIPVGQYKLPLQFTSHCTKWKSILPSSYRNSSYIILLKKELRISVNDN